MIKQIAIQTVYKGYKFRSRLEARWAVFFDVLGIDWEYEVEGYALPSGEWYLPDFMVTTPDGDSVFYEIKPKNTKPDSKFKEFQYMLEYKQGNERNNNSAAIMLSGDPYHVCHNFEKDEGVCPRCGVIDVFAYGVAVDEASISYGCMYCDFHTPSGGGHNEGPGILSPSRPHKGWQIVDHRDNKKSLNKIMAAATTARSARFEHGESP